jgi:hypothetical protein
MKNITVACNLRDIGVKHGACFQVSIVFYFSIYTLHVFAFGQFVIYKEETLKQGRA